MSGTLLPVTAEDLLSYHFLSQPVYSPDGSRAAFTVSQAAEDGLGYDSQLWLTEGGGLRKLVDLGRERQFAWLNGQTLLIPRAEDTAEEGSFPWVQVDAISGKISPFAAFPFQVKRLQVLDGQHLALVARLPIAAAEDYLLPAAQRLQAEKQRQQTESLVQVLDEVPFWANGEGLTSGLRDMLFLWSEAEGLRRISAPEANVHTFAVVGETLCYSADDWRRKHNPRGFRIRALHWPTGGDTPFAEDPLVNAEQLVAVGEKLWLLGTDAQQWGWWQSPWMYQVTAGGLTLIRDLDADTLGHIASDVSLGLANARQGSGDALYYLSVRGDENGLFRMDAQGVETPVFRREGAAFAFALHPDGEEILVVGQYDQKLQELYRYQPASGAWTQLSHFNSEALRGRYVALPEPLCVESHGETIRGWVLKPRDFTPSGSYPAILDIHGGPRSTYGSVFFHEMQLWASRGYFVFFCNPRGSEGRGNAFADIRGHYGEVDYDNLMDFTDGVLAAYPQIDKRRLCVTGGSYGGFMTNWIIGHTHRFRAAATQRAISNWVSMYISDIGLTFVREELAGVPYDGAENMWRQSPLKYAAAITTPTLVLHADADYRVPVSDGLQLLTVLLDRGIPTRFVLFHGEHHGLSRGGRPLNRLRRLREITDWFDHYTA